MRDIKRRINSVRNTQKITKAMKMVAAARLRKSQEMVEKARPFSIKTGKLFTRSPVIPKTIQNIPSSWIVGARDIYI